MQVNYDIRVELSQEEFGILKRAEGILQEFCLAYSQADQCELCPIREHCNENGTLDNQLYRFLNMVNVDDGIEEREYEPERIDVCQEEVGEV